MNKYKLIQKRGRQCEECKNTQWNGQPIPLEIHHINPPSEAEKHLKLLCPNCHALTPNYRGKGIKTAKSISDEKLADAVNKSKTMHQVLICLKLVPKGGNYEVLRKRLKKLGIGEKFTTKISTRCCLQCTNTIKSDMKFCCRECANKFNGLTTNKKRKIIWPSIEVVEFMVQNRGYREAGRQLKVSDNAVRKFLNRHKKVVTK